MQELKMLPGYLPTYEQRNGLATSRSSAGSVPGDEETGRLKVLEMVDTEFEDGDLNGEGEGPLSCHGRCLLLGTAGRNTQFQGSPENLHIQGFSSPTVTKGNSGKSEVQARFTQRGKDNRVAKHSHCTNVGVNFQIRFGSIRMNSLSNRDEAQCKLSMAASLAKPD
ncbi:hypothetical protein VNO77_02535 [Canavalia gladiata]|uniref:Uncharacterized protein n=1 Tax=Canavalia gladiata TaxID=3824 RepID=A0AAN9MZN8_CANGL